MRMHEMSELNFLNLYNCTDLLFHDTDANDSLNNGVRTVWDLNKTQLLTVLSIIIDDEDDTFDQERKELFKETLSRCLFPKRQRPHDLPLLQKAFWSVIFAAMLIVATTGNIIVMWIVLGHRRMRTVTNYFLVNLSVSDLLMSLLNCIFNCIFMINSDWPFGSVYCTINNFVANVSVAASVFTLVAISLDRYVAIVTPLKHRMSKATARITLFFIWFASCMLAFPCLLYSSTMTKSYRNGQTRTVCYMLWPDGRYPKSMTEYVYNLIFLSLTYLIPVIAMAICYTLMGRKLWGSQYIGEQTQCQVEAIRSKRKVVRMFIIIVTIFALCWLPYHGYFIYAYHNNSVADSSYVQHMYLAFYWLAMSNAMVNPIIYYWLNNRFRTYFRQIICKCCSEKDLKEDFELPDTKCSIRENVVRRKKAGHLQRRHAGKQVRLQNFVDKTILAEHSKHFSSLVSNSCSQVDT